MALVGETIAAVIEGFEMSDYVEHELDYSRLSKNSTMQAHLRSLMTIRRSFFKFFACIKDQQHVTKLKLDA